MTTIRLSRCCLAALCAAVLGGALAAPTAVAPRAGAKQAVAVEQPVDSADALAVSEDSGEQPVDHGLLQLEDATGTLDLAAVRALPPSRWQQPNALPLNFGYSRSAWWVHLRVHNPAATPTERMLDFGTALQDRIDAVVVRRGGRVEQLPPLGDRVPFANRPVRDVHPVVPLSLAGGETVDVYARLSTHDGLFEVMPLTLWTNDALRQAAQWHWFWSGMYYGTVGVLLIYNCFLVAATRHRSFTLYSGYLAASLLWRVTFSGDGFYLLWPGSPEFNNFVLPLATGAWFGFGSLFLSHYLRLARTMPRANKLLLGITALSTLALGSGAAGVYALPFLIGMPLGMVWWLGMCGCAVILARRGSRQALFPLMAWTPLMVGASAYMLQLVGVPALQALPPSGALLQIGLAAQVLLLGLGLAHNTNQWRKERFVAERQARIAQEQLATTLEAEVELRTRALETANAQLRTLTLTDALTGVFNRRHFNEALETELAQLAHHGDMPALCLLDIDHFKAYNDLYGHQKGDTALKAVAAALRQGMRRDGDRVFRVGGEEFALLLVPDDPHVQQRHVESLRAAIEALQLPHRGNPGAGVITASFGLVQMPPQSGSAPTPNGLYREADRLLYRAKADGRNRVCWDDRPVAEWAPSTDFAPATV